MKVLCIGDSLALPGHGNKYEDTWVYKLKRKFIDYDFITYFKRILTTEVLVTEGGGPGDVDGFWFGSDMCEVYMPDVVILQLGIVDCAPRLIAKKSIEHKIVARMPDMVKGKYIRLIKKYRKRTKKNAYVNPTKFEQNVTSYIKRCKINQVKKIIIIAIPEPSEQFIIKNPKVVESVLEYNNIYEKICSEYDNEKIVFPLKQMAVDIPIYEDGYHPNSSGNQLVYESVEQELLKIG